MAKKKPIKWSANRTPESIEYRIAFRCGALFHSAFRNAKGAITKAPPRFRQKINVGTGIKLLAIIGPELPMPKTPSERKAMSRPAGRAV
jgi:hypothetical protein